MRRNVCKLAVSRWALRELRMGKRVEDEKDMPAEYAVRVRGITAVHLPETEIGVFSGKQVRAALATLATLATLPR